MIRNRKVKSCKICRDNIYTNEYYYPQRNKKAICFKCKNNDIEHTWKILNLIAIMLVLIVGLVYL